MFKVKTEDTAGSLHQEALANREAYEQARSDILDRVDTRADVIEARLSALEAEQRDLKRVPTVA